MNNIIRNEPARVVAVVLAVIGVLTAFGLGITDGQSAAVVALVGAALALFGGEVTRSQVTPVGKHRADETGATNLILAIFLGVLLALVAWALLTHLLAR